MINNVAVEDSQELVNHFNIFFVYVCSDLFNKIVLNPFSPIT